MAQIEWMKVDKYKEKHLFNLGKIDKWMFLNLVDSVRLLDHPSCECAFPVLRKDCNLGEIPFFANKI